MYYILALVIGIHVPCSVNACILISCCELRTGKPMAYHCTPGHQWKSPLFTSLRYRICVFLCQFIDHILFTGLHKQITQSDLLCQNHCEFSVPQSILTTMKRERLSTIVKTLVLKGISQPQTKRER